VTLARRAGVTIRPFDRVITSTMPRAFETALVQHITVYPWESCFGGRPLVSWRRTCYNLFNGARNSIEGEMPMLAVRGVFEKGRARPITSIRGREGQPVIITFLEEPAETERVAQVGSEDAWQAMTQLVESCEVETGIRDLAHRHDDYLHHRPPES
jgi:hypothetical protein